MAEETKTKAPEMVAPAAVEGPRKSVQICTGSAAVGEGDNRRWVPKFETVRKESDLHAGLIAKGFEGPVVSKVDGAKVYVTVDAKKLRFHPKTGALLAALLALLLGAFSLQPSAYAQFGTGRTSLKIAATEAPFVTLSGVTGYPPATLLTVNYTAGKIYLGDTAVAVAAGNLAGLTASKATCSRPAYSACNIIYSTSAGTVATTLALATAQASGNSILAFVQTDTTKVTEIRYPWQDTGFPTASLSGAFVLTSGTLTPGATSGAIQTTGQALTIAGVTTGDNVRLISYPAPTSLCPPVGARATGTDEVTIYFTTLTASACTPASGVYKVLVVR